MHIQTIIDKLILKRNVSEIKHYQDFQITLVADRPWNEFPSTINLYLGSDWYLNSKEWWADFITKFPIDTSTMAFPYEPVKAFAIYILGQGPIDSVRIAEDNTIELSFFNTYKLIIPGTINYSGDNKFKEPEFEFSWIIYSESDDKSAIRISCNGNGKLEVSGIS